MTLFRKNKRRRENDPLEEIRAQFDTLDTRFRRLEESLDSIKNKFPQITIDHVHIHQPVLEKLEFRLDGLDIEHLSGSLNLGNNFGTKVSPPSNPSSAQKKEKKEQTHDPGITPTSTGFRLNNRR